MTSNFIWTTGVFKGHKFSLLLPCNWQIRESFAVPKARIDVLRCCNHCWQTIEKEIAKKGENKEGLRLFRHILNM